MRQDTGAGWPQRGREITVSTMRLQGEGKIFSTQKPDDIVRSEAPIEADGHLHFDVFLSHNSKDKPAVRELGRALGHCGVKVWLDENELVPGENWQNGLVSGILRSIAVAVCIGQVGIGPWEDEEMQASLAIAVREKRRIIPVMLPNAPDKPDLSLFLANRTWVDLRAGFTEDGLAKLIWGITGKKP
jgi:hypothetical protein